MHKQIELKRGLPEKTRIALKWEMDSNFVLQL